MNLGKCNDDTLRRDGCGQIEIERVAGQSAMTSLWSASPFKILVPQSRGSSVWAFTSSFGGGMVGGDQTRLDITVRRDARAFIGTQASTKIYRHPGARSCSHITTAIVEPGALLVFAPDPVQAFADSSYTQRQEFQMAPDGGLVLLDWYSSGRAARGERWAFARFESRNDVFIDGERVFVDSLRLSAADGSLDRLHRTGRFNCCALLLFVGALTTGAAGRLLADIAARPVERRGRLICSASPVREGAALRVAGECVEEVTREIHRHLKPLAELLGDNPWARKW